MRVSGGRLLVAQLGQWLVLCWWTVLEVALSVSPCNTHSLTGLSRELKKKSQLVVTIDRGEE